jgi:hypothetical protein
MRADLLKLLQRLDGSESMVSNDGARLRPGGEPGRKSVTA